MMSQHFNGVRMDEPKIKRDQYIPIRLDVETVALLDDLARENEGNRSLTMRQLIRKEAARQATDTCEDQP